ncbi:MAG: hypothetical protein WKF59_07415 [Chitinophagaceae bacterium]
MRRFNKGIDKPFGATVGVLNGVLQMIEDGLALEIGARLSSSLLPSSGARTINHQ